MGDPDKRLDLKSQVERAWLTTIIKCPDCGNMQSSLTVGISQGAQRTGVADAMQCQCGKVIPLKKRT